MKALVTGATGFIGSHVADELLEKGYSVRCTYRKSSNLRWLDGKNFDLFETDLYDKDSIKKALEGIDYVFHVAGVVSARNHQSYLRGNLDPTKNLIEACLELNINLERFVYISSLSVSGPSQSFDNPLTEVSECNPITSYAKSKKAAEDFVRKHIDKMPITIVRPPGVFGPRDTAIFTIFQAVSMHVAPCFGFSDKYVSLAYSKDLAKGIVESAETEKTLGQIYFIAYNKFFSYKEMFSYVQKAMGGRFVFNLIIPEFIILTAGYVTELLGRFRKEPPVFNYEKGKDFIQKYWTCSVEKAKCDFGFESKTPIDIAIQETVDWYLSQGWIK